MIRVVGPKVLVNLCVRMYRDLRKEQSKALYSFGMGFAWASIPWIPDDEKSEEGKRRNKRWTAEQLEIARAGHAAGEQHEVKSHRQTLPAHEG